MLKTIEAYLNPSHNKPVNMEIEDDKVETCTTRRKTQL